MFLKANFRLLETFINVNIVVYIHYCCLYICYTFILVVLFVNFCLIVYHFLCWCFMIRTILCATVHNLIYNRNCENLWITITLFKCTSLTPSSALPCLLYDNLNSHINVLESECLWLRLLETFINVNIVVYICIFVYCCLCILFTFIFVMLFVDFCLIV